MDRCVSNSVQPSGLNLRQCWRRRCRRTAGTIFNDDGLAERGIQSLSLQPRYAVDRAAGRIRQGNHRYRAKESWSARMAPTDDRPSNAAPSAVDINRRFMDGPFSAMFQYVPG